MLIVVILLLILEFNQGRDKFYARSWSEDVHIACCLVRWFDKSIIETVLELSDDAGLRYNLVKSLEVNHLSFFDILGSDILVLINLH